MTDLFEALSFFGYLITGSLWIFGVYALFDNDHLLGKLGDWIELKTSTNFIRPLFCCPPCMASAHGLLIGLLLFGASLTIIPYVICLCGLNFIIKKAIFHD